MRVIAYWTKMYSGKTSGPSYEVVFDECKFGGELPLRKLRRALQMREMRSSTSRHNISSHTLSEGSVYVVYSPQQPLTAEECASLKKFVQSDARHALMVVLSEGGEAKNGTNVNYLLQEFGIVANNDAVIRQVFHKYTHPKECLISLQTTPASAVLYPFGCSLNVEPPAVTLLSSGATSYPVNRPLVAASEVQQGGRLLVLGSAAFLSDSYIDYEQNMQLSLGLFDWLLGRSPTGRPPHIVHEGSINEYQYLPNLVQTADTLRPCLLEPPRIPVDVGRLSQREFYLYSNKHVNEITQLLQTHITNTKFQPLTLIQPKFNVPLPPLMPAVYPAALEDIGGPPLELFDLDDVFMPPKLRLAQLANNCAEADVDFFVREAAKIVGAHPSGTAAPPAPKEVLLQLLHTIVEFKKFK